MPINFNPIHKFFNPLYCNPPPKKKATLTTISVLFGVATAGIPHAIYFTGKGINYLATHISYEGKKSKEAFSDLASVEIELDQEEIAKSKKFWDTKFVTPYQGWKKERKNKIIELLAHFKLEQCPYTEIYVVYNRVEKSDLIFSDDGCWSLHRKQLENLTKEEKAKILVLFIPEDQGCSDRWTKEWFRSLEKFNQENPLPGMTLRSITLDDYEQIQKNKLPKNLVSILQGGEQIQ